jgi:hypothetical protein
MPYALDYLCHAVGALAPRLCLVLDPGRVHSSARADGGGRPGHAAYPRARASAVVVPADAQAVAASGFRPWCRYVWCTGLYAPLAVCVPGPPRHIFLAREKSVLSLIFLDEVVKL